MSTRTKFEAERHRWREHVLALPTMNTRAALLVWNIAHWFDFRHWKDTSQLLAYPSFDRLQQGMAAGSRHTVGKAMADLERMGAIQVNRTTTGMTKRNQYVGLWRKAVHPCAPRQRGKRTNGNAAHAVHTAVHSRSAPGCT